MEEIRTSIDKMFDQFIEPNDTSHIITKRLSFNGLNNSNDSANFSPKKRKYCYDQNDISFKMNNIGSCADEIDGNLTRTSFNNSMGTAPPSPWEYRRLKADLVENNAMTAYLKKEIENRVLLHNKMETMLTDKVNNLQNQLDRSNNKVNELEKHLKHVRRRQGQETEELVKVKNQFQLQKQGYEDQLGKIKRNNLDLENNLRRAKHDMGATIDELQEQLKRVETTYRLTQEELESLQDAHDAIQEKVRKFVESKLLLEQEKLENEKLQRKIQTLENEISTFGEWKELSKTFHNRLAKLPDLEKELEKLHKDNKNLYDTIGHKLLLEEEVINLRGRIEKSEISNAEAIQLKVQLQTVEKELEQYKQIAKDHCSGEFITPPILRLRIESILQRDIYLANEKNSVKNEKTSFIDQIQDLSRDLERYKKSNTDLQTSLKSHKFSLNRIQKKLMLVARERDCYRQLTENYEKDLTISNVQSELSADTQLKLRVEMLEKTLLGYKEMCSSLEKDIQISKSLPDMRVESIVNGEHYQLLKNEMENLRIENDRLRRCKDELELTLEQMSLKGAYNIDKFKIVHMSMNPADDAHKEQKQDIVKLQAEVERLKRKNRKLEEEQQELTLRLNNTTNTTADLKDIATLHNHIKTLETKNQHLKEVYKAAGLELREACYLMFGYRIDRIDNQHYKISSMYAESEEDYLHFRINAGSLNMLETHFSKTLEELSKTYLGKYQSVPAFLSMLQLELFNRTTLM